MAVGVEPPEALDWIAGQVATASGGGRADVSLRMAQSMSCTFQKEIAHAILKRTVEAPL